MRNITIERKKSFVGCLMKDQVYIRDEAAPELTIAGVPCRKVGVVKNGGKFTFQAGEGEQKIFLIADKVSKDYCYGTATVPAGTEDAELTGKHKFILGSNPFVFEGVEQSAEEKAKLKKNGGKGVLIFIAALAAGLLVGNLVSGALLDAEPSPKIFRQEDFQITLTNRFQETEVDGCFVAYDSNIAAVFVVREEKELFEGYTLSDYTDLIIEVNGHQDQQKHTSEKGMWFEYTSSEDGQDAYYLAGCFESQEAFWIVTIALRAEDRSEYSDNIRQMMDSIIVGNVTG